MQFNNPITQSKRAPRSSRVLNHLITLALMGGIGCAERTAADAGESGDTGDPGDTGGIGECADLVGLTLHPEEVDDRWSASISADIAAAHDVIEGDHVRIREPQTGTEMLFTVEVIGEQDPPGLIGLSASGLARFGEPPFEGCVTTRIAPAPMTPDEAMLVGEFVEPPLIHHGLSDVLLLAPHGGDIELGTYALAERVAELWQFRAPTLWGSLGWGDEDHGAFEKWHVSSDSISPRSFPELATIANLGFSRVVSFHGHGGSGGGCGFADNDAVVIGGNASSELLGALRDAIDDELLAESYVVRVADVDVDVDVERCAGTSADNIVNRLSACGEGVQLELNLEVRQDEEAIEEIAATVVEVLDAWPGCPR